MAAHSALGGDVRTLGAVPVHPDTSTIGVPAHVPVQVPAQKALTDARNVADGRESVPEQGAAAEQPRTAQSLLAESSFQDWTDTPDAERPLARTRARHASALFNAMKRFNVSLSRLAMMLGVADRQARKYLDGRAPVPTTIDDVLPSEMRAEFQRLRSSNNAAANFRAALAELEREGAPPDLIAEGHMRLGALAARGAKR